MMFNTFKFKKYLNIYNKFWQVLELNKTLKMQPF